MSASAGEFVEMLHVFYVTEWLGTGEAYSCQPYRQFLNKAGYAVPLGTVVVYLICVHLLPLRFGWKSLKPLFGAWNFFLSIFSFWALACILPYTVRGYRQKGLYWMVCSDDVTVGIACYDRHVTAALAFFVLFKFVELGDTLFLILMDSKVSLLHWYHHATVLLFCWFTARVAAPTSVTFGAVNSLVHSVMYAYFGFTQFKGTQKAFAFMRKPITTIQLFQMVVGTFLVVSAFYFKSTGECSNSYSNEYFMYCGGMYVSYMFLFAHLYYESYLRKKTSSPGLRT
eukprot:gnl/TRDRNA2_/TRDRNA2_142898_c0_seq2.p1 gnl/TRDRNA2_/TRDRNA2_142898_c0~~gnl/TRDRNA2_/TRDRNA2_142898_c0_seq2.p1  ORF type:complete len:322 (+),score=40.76 gnl/TRDRNA2_/TRDRNA2_142898_c0_seq2:116-967(+)